ncbi:SIR2 family protein [Pseudomonas oryzae]|uniref:SIR2-like domain-containing protein n=1 Tax=Pseudomonas oryzae TaxID=1392877 RepID=A0A1H1QPE7_9PSED|nr:SIR2 family protein [Pseudomonas oryzae]SDS25213.1 SIR2-like domain-containing protein [Pseudomonas oryzae]
MRFHPDGPSIPDILLERCDAGRVVFLCGAGVSLPSGMPTFVGLTQYVIDFFDPPADSEIMAAFLPWLDDQSAANVPLDQIFNLLHLEYGKDEVNALVTERLSAPLKIKDFGREHGLIKRISSSQSGVPQIVTTNFDRLFEVGQEEKKLVRHVPPAFPDLNFGSKIEGVTYLHGRLVEVASESHPYVLSSADFGRAYLSEGWATNFIRHLLERYTVVLVGYKAEDPPVKYLLQGLNHDGQYDRSRLYAFDRGLPEEIEAKWRDRGVTAIAYSDHPELWRSMEAWADRADDPRRWRASIIAKSQQDPKDLAPHERGQVAHVLRTVQGARLFSEADPAPHPEWVCVMDANVRSAKESRGYGDDAEVFDPGAAYGLDDDMVDISEDDRRQGVSNENLLVWRDEDDNPHEFHRLGGQQAVGFEALPKRLWHLTTWASKSIDSPVLAWWAIRQNGLHPRLLQQIEWQMEHSKTLHERARHIWNLILEYHRDPRNRQWNGDWFDLKSRINAEGWTASVLREFRRVATPRLEIKLPYGLGQSRPPCVPWEKIYLGELGQFEVMILERHNEDLDVPDDQLQYVFGILEEQLNVASGLLEDIEAVYFQKPTCYPDREVDGREHISNPGEIVTWFVQLFDRMAAKWPELANAHAMTWPATERFFFRKLKLYAYSKVDAFEADHVAKEVLSLDQETFWSVDVVRELLFLLVDRWREFSQESRNQLADRILTGPDQLSHWPDEEFHWLRDKFAARYARYLELQGCELTADRSEKLAEMIRGIPGWSDGLAVAAVSKGGSQGGWVGTDETPDELMDLPVNEVISKAKGDLKREFGSFTEKRPFTGLVKANPRKALSALTIAGRAGDYPEAFWSSMINELPADITPRLRRVFLNRVARLPHVVIAKLGHTFGRWLRQNLVAFLEFDYDLGLAVYDYIVDGILSGGVEAAKSGLGEVRQGGKVIQRSRRTFSHAINGPIGMCADALFHAVPGEKQEAYSLIPEHIKSRVERLFAAPGEGSDHAVSIASRNLNWLMFVDPGWTQKRLTPMLAFEHPASEPAWNGFLHSEQVPSQPLTEIIKPLLLDLFPWVEGFSWDRNLSAVAAQWLGFLRMFHPNEPSGLSRGEMRSIFRAMSDDTRNRFISWLGQVGQKNESGWAKHVIPLINEDWPRERRYRTSASMRAWIGLLDDTGDSFPAVYEAVKKFLVPVETNDHPFYRFTREISDEKPITAQFPEATLDLMNRATPQVLTRPPYELPKVLALIAETEPDLTSDPRYLRLIDLVERS